MSASNVHIFGIRHHGPGSARSLRAALKALGPDCILVEGPPEAEEVLRLAAHEEMKPPVALLIYDPEKPKRATYDPFAEFSPEWQAIQYGFAAGSPVRFIDLPQAIQFGIVAEREAQEEAEAKAAELANQKEEDSGEDGNEEGKEGEEIDPEMPAAEETPKELYIHDPLRYLAEAAGYSDSERWWEHMVEHRRGDGDVFGAVLEAMAALRDAALSSGLQRIDPLRENRREAYMRQCLRAAQKEGFQRIAIVCGAWHGPALASMPPAKDDAALLKGLPKRKVVATWVPWTFGRLAQASGYGAGVESPGWYDFLWQFHNSAPGSTRNGASASRDTELSVEWLTRVARLLREQDLDASSASIIEGVRLAESLASMRGRPLPGLPELHEATRTVLCFGDDLPFRLISQKLVIGERLGAVPAETPLAPVAQDLAREQKRLRLPPEANPRQLDLDLRKPNDLERSRLLHRLVLLGIPWGERQSEKGSQKGTFHELWTVEWEPEYAIPLIEAGVWGNTVASAASAKIRLEADASDELPVLTQRLDSTLLADLPEAADYLISRIQTVAAIASDVGHLMGALPPLAAILRYGNVRQTDSAVVGSIVNGLVSRICIGLPASCGALNDEAAEAMHGQILDANGAIALLQQEMLAAVWRDALRHLADSVSLHGLIAGRACRLLLDAQEFSAVEAARRFGLALSAANGPPNAAAWADGFLRGSGLLLLHDETLWQVLDDWAGGLAPDHFIAVLPLLRRTFSTFAAPERRQMGQRVAQGPAMSVTAPVSPGEFDEARASRALPLIAQLLGLKIE